MSNKLFWRGNYAILSALVTTVSLSQFTVDKMWPVRLCLASLVGAFVFCKSKD